MRNANFIKSFLLPSLLLVGLCFVLNPISAKAFSSDKPNYSHNIDSGDEKFDRIFREGREAMDKEDWKQAIEKFNQVATEYLENKRVDAALYWLAYCYKKQKMTKEANSTIDRLLNKFPNSSWAGDARVLKIEVVGVSVLNPSGTIEMGQINGVSISPPNPMNTSKPLMALTETNIFYQESKLDREDEIKLAAFQSLVANDPKKGIEAVGRLLQSDSKASETLKREVLRSLRGSRFTTYRYSAVGVATTEITPTVLVTQINPILRETLVKGFQTEPNLTVRSEIIYSIANINDEPSITYLAQLYPNESNKDLKKVIINSFTVGTTSWIGVQGFAPLVATTTNKVEAEKLAVAATSQAGVITTNQTPKTNPIRELRLNSLMTIFRNEKELELRRLAFGNIQRFAGWSTRDGMIDSLAQLYDSETDEQFKVSIIYSFSNLSKNPQATNKLLDIAKNDKSDKMRLEAIRALRNNNSPEVIKFLENLIQ